jgi:hypothetical protein
LPVLEHPSARPLVVQSTHSRPEVPQVVVERARHVVPSQQPDAHDIVSQMQAPSMHRCPVAHGAPLPHRHAPPAHVSERPSQATHTSPPVPHAIAVGGELQVDPEQHPLATQSRQAAPLAPQVVAVRLTQTSPSQQPDGHEVASHTHAPDTQR